jgi:nicotinate-nucleotide pyrophosphorylase (carboxylating)
VWKAKENGIIAGLHVAESVFKKLDPDLIWEEAVEDGGRVREGEILVEMKGRSRAILTAERTALNFVQRMSGIATVTSEYVALLEDSDTKILDTRKTAPGLRIFDKYAVAMGGGENHRMGLYDLAMIKDNHIVAAGGIKKAVQQVRKKHPDLNIEVETTNIEQLKEALNVEADIIMLDNMSLDDMSRAVSVIKNRALIEASGNITLNNVREVAQTGVDFISIGALTHSVKAFDISQYLTSE